jgi:hypothetical protein
MSEPEGDGDVTVYCTTSPPSVDGPRQVALFRLRRLEAEAMSAGESAVAGEFTAILEREVARDQPREA